jgi:hypothetical protein
VLHHQPRRCFALLDKNADYNAINGEGPRPLAQVLDRVDADGARRT